jgi:hypothetical protein
MYCIHGFHADDRDIVNGPNFLHWLTDFRLTIKTKRNKLDVQNCGATGE